MTVDYFLIEGPRAIPTEFNAWREAEAQHSELFFRFCDEPTPELENEAIAAGKRAKLLEETARTAFLLWLARP